MNLKDCCCGFLNLIIKLICCPFIGIWRLFSCCFCCCKKKKFTKDEYQQTDIDIEPLIKDSLASTEKTPEKSPIQNKITPGSEHKCESFSVETPPPSLIKSGNSQIIPELDNLKKKSSLLMIFSFYCY